MVAGLPSLGGLFRQLKALAVDINAGAIDGTTVGATTPASGAFTTLSSTQTATLQTLSVTGTSSLAGLAVTGAMTFDGTTLANTATVALSAGTATNAMLATITMLDNAGNTATGVHAFEFYFSESSTGQGLTADTYSGNLTANTGTILTAITAKKHVLGVTATTGIAVLQIVDTNEPADQYAVVKSPTGSRAIISAASGTNWQ